MKKQGALPWFGGKNPANPVNKWINSVIGFDPKKSYIEPFAGMLGVLLSRQKVITELVNDYNSNLVNWWLCVRDNPEELACLMEKTPFSREVFAHAIKNINSKKYKKDKIKRAMFFHVMISQSVKSCETKNVSDWIAGYSNNRGVTTYKLPFFAALSSRLERVRIENTDAIKILKKSIDVKDCVIYCDPPYLTADTSPYGDFPFNKDEFVDVFKNHKADIAISGYSDEWDFLGFEKSTFETKFIGRNRDTKTTKRTEHLWTNFKPRNAIESEGMFSGY